MTRKEAIALIVPRALANVQHLPPLERADLFEAAAFFLRRSAAEKARLAAFQLREAEHCQLTFLTQLAEGEG